MAFVRFDFIHITVKESQSIFLLFQYDENTAKNSKRCLQIYKTKPKATRIFASPRGKRALLHYGALLLANHKCSYITFILQCFFV